MPAADCRGTILPMSTAGAGSAPGLRARAAGWLGALSTNNVPEDARLDVVSKWLIATRASVLPMTLFASGIGGLLAIPAGGASPWLWFVATVGLLLAHIANNLMNDYFDTRSGVDTPGYARTQYAPHPLLSGLVSMREMLGAIAVVNALGVLVALYLTWARGPLALLFALCGFAISLFYVAPPLRLKHHGLGEPSVFVIWGPLMIGGTYFITCGRMDAAPFWASLPYGLLVMCVLFGKHIDKCAADTAKGIHTLPVLLGTERARRATQGMIAAFFAGIALEVATGVLTPWTLAVFFGIPRAVRVWKVFGQPTPARPPAGYPLWPLWYVAAAFVLIRQVGLLFVAGLALDLLLPLR
jgi:1,4-dihydroxy-2-naphthoate polyprenyltransferase